MIVGLKRIVKLSLIALIAATAISAQQDPPKASRIRVIVYKGEMASLLHRLADDNGVTIGLEVDPKAPKSEVEINLRDVDLKGILNGIVQAAPGYGWRENDGCIEVFPVARGLGLLDTPISSFQVQDVNRDVAVNRLLARPEVQSMILSMNLKPRPLDAPSDRIKDEKLSFNLSGVTLRDALNRIAHDSGGNFWVLRRYADDTFEIILPCC
jgi:hypothetical protein